MPLESKGPTHRLFIKKDVRPHLRAPFKEKNFILVLLNNTYESSFTQAYL